ncbi:MAG TPA: hypothetical protein IAA75_02805 [Candidatus Pullichristensenella avicola]|nr:hypothetical protein [Candidatus Pullichristensenella avicola]
MRMMQKRFLALMTAACLLGATVYAEAPATATQTPSPAPTAAQTVAPEAAQNTETTTSASTQTQTDGMQPTQTDGMQPTQTNGAQPTQTNGAQPTQTDGAQPTQTTGAQPTQTNGAQPTQTTGAQPTQTNGAGTPTPTPSPSPSVSPSPESELNEGESASSTTGEGPAWYWNGEEKHFGDLEALLLLTDETIYIASDELFVLTGEAAQRAQEADLALDAEVFPEEEEYVLWISDIGPNGEAQQGALYLWAGKEEDGPAPSAEPTPTDDPTDIEAELLVVPEMYLAGAWSSTAPSFTLAVVPDTLTGYTFAVSVDDGEAQAAESPYSFATEGQHTLVFTLFDPSGAQVARSTTYSVWLDATAPEAQAQFDAQTGTLSVVATDALSGVDAVSLDGGKTWQAMTAAEDGASAFTTVLTSQVAAGDLLVRDAAGNCWQSAESYGVPGGMGGDFGGIGGMGGGFGGSFSGAGGGSSGSTRTVSHSSGSDAEATPYGAVALEVPETSMLTLTLGGEELSLTLTLDCDAGAARTAAAFTAELAVWNGAEGDENYDTLILTASGEGAESPYAYRWDFSGDVYKTLFNSGIEYLVLRVNDRVTALSTAGFTAGAAYNALKSAGAASSEFHYSLWMGEPDPELELEVEARGARYLLNAGEGDMYYYDVYTGDMDMLSAAFGAAQQEGA